MGVTSTHIFKNVTINQCCCRLWVSMKLPCCHIFFVRETLGLDLFDECICNQRWTMQYYESNQRVFLTKGASDSNSAQVSVVQSTSRKVQKKFCHRYNTLYFMHTLDLNLLSILQFEKFHKVSTITTKLASLASESTHSEFSGRCELLEQLINAWEQQLSVTLVYGMMYACIMIV